MKKIFLNILFLLIGMVVFNINVSAYELGSLIEYNKNIYYVISDNGDSLTLIK